MCAKSFYSDSFSPGPLRLACGTNVNKAALATAVVLTGPLNLLSLTDQEKDWGTLSVEAGETYFVKEGAGWRSWLKLVPEPQAEKELRKCEWLNPSQHW